MGNILVGKTVKPRPPLEIKTCWISIKEHQPQEGMIIVYCWSSPIIACVGRYNTKEYPMPSAPYWLPWDKVTHWFPLPEIKE